MWEFITQPANLWFSVALTIMLMLGILEIINLFVGGISDWLDQLLPESLADHAIPDIHLDATSTGAFVQFLTWLYIGRVPVLMWLVVFLASYGVAGLILQHIWLVIFNQYLVAWLAGIVVFFLVLPIVRYVSMGLYRILPKDFTTAIYSDELIGSVAQIVIGEARQGYPAQAKLKDQFGQTHYIMVEPDQDQVLKQGHEILLVSKHNTIFKAILKDQV
ncbi:YqiJ family protein [Acinetobacter populi]|uniref:DUF1449 domain-containing protein n=1 Tax=Acinetobacter populi TaxID=1582270 RepID=A0A1Z9YUT8_9GAMM|nr:YqiJ family protein [Acinetobacter populi]OUY05971.1 hypothetical protein CAP51_14765 [Acinetobacter populi]